MKLKYSIVINTGTVLLGPNNLDGYGYKLGFFFVAVDVLCKTKFISGLSRSRMSIQMENYLFKFLPNLRYIGLYKMSR